MPGCTHNAPGFSLAGLTNNNFDSSLAFAAHPGLHLPVGHTPQPGPVCISLALRPSEDKGVALTTLLKEWLDRSDATKEEFASLSGKLHLAANGVFTGGPSLERVLANERRAGTRACEYALARFIPAPSPALRHDFDIPDGEVRVPGCTHNASGSSLAGLTNDNFDSSPALAAHLGLHLPVGHTPQPGPVCISLILRPPEDKGVAPTTLLKEWLGRPNTTKEEFARF